LTRQTKPPESPGRFNSPAWIAENTAQTSWTATIGDLIGGLGLTIDQTGTPTYTYANLHGDTLATAPAGAASPTISTDYDEYGQPTDGQTRRYGWLGSKQRSGDTQAPPSAASSKTTPSPAAAPTDTTTPAKTHQ
jgi:hypothetical protein